MSNVSEMKPVDRIKAWLNCEIELSDAQIDQALDEMTPNERIEWMGRCLVYLTTNNDNALK